MLFSVNADDHLRIFSDACPKPRIKKLCNFLLDSMGVRSYTPVIHFIPARRMTQQIVTPWKKAAQVIVDWSQMPVDSSDDVQLEVDHLMQWVDSYPKRAAVHVYLSRSRFATRDRMLQNTLQSLGCTVTMRSPIMPR